MREPPRNLRRASYIFITKNSGQPNDELIAHNRTVEQIRDFVEVDSLSYLSLDGMLACMKHPKDSYCTACWSGNYKITIDHPQTKFSFEREQLRMF